MQRTQDQLLATAQQGANVRRHCFTNMRAAWLYSYSTVRFYNNEGIRCQDHRFVKESVLPAYQLRQP